MVEIKVSAPTKIQVSGFEDNKVGTFQSVLAGIGAGLIDIPRGAFSLGASLLDLGLGTNKAAQVENFFDNLTTFDEQAEATTAGEIARIIANLGVPGTVAFKAGSRLTKQALAAKKNKIRRNTKLAFSWWCKILLKHSISHVSENIVIIASSIIYR